jgi:hypothetical protein
MGQINFWTGGSIPLDGVISLSTQDLVGGGGHDVFELELIGRDADLRLFGRMGSLTRGQRLRFA